MRKVVVLHDLEQAVEFIAEKLTLIGDNRAANQASGKS